MDKILDLTRKLGHELQNDERFLKTQLAQSAADEDSDLQKLIGEFNLKRIALNNEMTKDEKEKDKDKLKQLDGEIREVYARLMENSHMQAYQKAKEDLDKLVGNIVKIITMSSQGQNPDEVEESSCSGNCSGCSSCN